MDINGSSLRDFIVMFTFTSNGLKSVATIYPEPMTSAIVAKKQNIKVVHIEAGICYGNMTMPEKINRIITDSITDYFFTTSTSAFENLLKTDVDTSNLHFVGNVMIDTLHQNLNRIVEPLF